MKEIIVKCYKNFYSNNEVHTFSIMAEEDFDPLDKPLLKTECPECKCLREVHVEFSRKTIKNKEKDLYNEMRHWRK